MLIAPHEGWLALFALVMLRPVSIEHHAIVNAHQPVLRVFDWSQSVKGS